MGGSSKKTMPVQTPQSTAALGGANTAAGGLSQLGSQYAGQQQQLFNMLWGAPMGNPSGVSTTAPNFGGGNPVLPVPPGGRRMALGAGGRPIAPAMSRGGSTTGAPVAGGPGAAGGTGGALTGFLNPANLNVTSPTGPFAGAFTNDKTQLARTSAQNAENIKSQAAQSGFGASTPSGITADQLRANNSDLANNVGNAFTTETGNAYQAALNNFWNAANAAQGGAATAQSGALGGTGAAGSLYNNIYGRSLGQNTQSNSGAMGVLSPLIGAGGTVGAAAMGK